MKKIALATILAVAVSTAQAADVGVNAGWDDAGKKGDSTLGLSVSLPVRGPYGLAVELDKRSELNRFGVLGTYDVAKVLGASVVAKAGLASVDPDRGNNVTLVQVGVGATLPLVDKLSLSADYRYQIGEGSWDGNRVFAGFVYKF
jgi:outer membrane autotransporter protein